MPLTANSASADFFERASANGPYSIAIVAEIAACVTRVITLQTGL
jgi:hypothetical protein